MLFKKISLFKASFYTLFFSLIQIFFIILNVRIINQNFGIEGYGFYSLCLYSANFIFIFNLNHEEYIQRYLRNFSKKKSNHIILNAIFYRLVSYFIFIIIVLIIYFLKIINLKFLIFISFLAFSLSFLQLFSILMKVLGKYFLADIITSIPVILLFIILIQNFKIENFILYYSFFLFFITLFLLVFISLKTKFITGIQYTKNSKNFFKFTNPLYVSKSMNVFTVNIIPIIVKYFFSLELLGIYAIAHRIYELANSTFFKFSQYLLPYFSDYSQEKFKKILSNIFFNLILIYSISLPIFAFSFSNIISIILFIEDKILFREILILFFIALGFRNFGSLINLSSYLLNKTNFIMKLTFIKSIIDIFGTIFLIIIFQNFLSIVLITLISNFIIFSIILFKYRLIIFSNQYYNLIYLIIMIAIYVLFIFYCWWF